MTTIVILDSVTHIPHLYTMFKFCMSCVWVNLCGSVSKCVCVCVCGTVSKCMCVCGSVSKCVCVVV